MPGKMRARHEVFGVHDVPDTQFYRDNGWVEVAPSTRTFEQDRVDAINAARRGDLTEQPAAAVVAAMGALPDEDRERVVAAEKASAKPRKTVLNAD